MKLVKFIKLKTQNASFAQIARLELENWVCGLIRPIPGGIGMLIRSFVLKLFFKNHHVGFTMELLGELPIRERLF